MSDKLTFEYDPALQRSPEWLARKRGKIGSSRLSDWLATSKAKATLGKPLKPRMDYEKELMFERTFGVSFQVWVSDAMQEGIDLEDFARKQYQQITGATDINECGCWYNDYFVASPDRLVGDDGLIEIKIVKDTTFTEVLYSGVPDKHMKQIQGQLWASGRKWCDYVCVNLNSKKVVIIRVEADTEFHEYLNEAVQEQLVTEAPSLDNVHDIKGEIPQGLVFEASKQNDNSSTGGW